MKVYLVKQCSYDNEKKILGIFSTEEKAKERALSIIKETTDKLGKEHVAYDNAIFTIEEYILDSGSASRYVDFDYDSCELEQQIEQGNRQYWAMKRAQNIND